jgi:ATP-binding cassette subfamily B protein
MVQFRGYEEEALPAALDFAHLRRLWPFVRPYRRAFAGCLLLLGVTFALEVLGPFLLRLLIDGPLARAADGATPDATLIYLLGLGYLGISVTGALCNYGYTVLTAKNGQLVIRDVRTRLFAHLMRLSPRFFDRNPAGKLVTRVTSDVENLSELITTGVLQALFDVVKITGILAVLFCLDLRLAFYTIAATPVIVVLSLVFRRYARAAFRRVRGRLARQNGFTAELIGGVRATRVFGQHDNVQRHFEELNRGTRRGWQQTILYFALFFSVIDLALRWGQVGLLYVGGTGILAGTVSAGLFVQFWLYFGKLTDPIKEIGEKYNVLQSALSSCERIFQIFDERPAPVERDDAGPSAPGEASIRFDRVSFGYDRERPVLHDVSFEVEPGTTCAIVGPTGAGKSTILALVSRLHDPDAGQILLDGRPLPTLSLDSMRQRIAVVQQDVFLFTGTIADNVRSFDERIPDQRVRDALAAVGALDFVEALPGQLDAPVEERGATFSLGERQLLSFARALAADPDVLLLDEATANVDSATEARIQHALTELLRGRTCIVVAHRLSTVRNAEQILVLRDGRIVERGRHADLVRARGVYATMLESLGSP